MRRTFLYLLSGLLLKLLLFDHAVAFYASDSLQRQADWPTSTKESITNRNHFPQKELNDITHAEYFIIEISQRNGTERHPEITMFDYIDCSGNFDFKNSVSQGMDLKTLTNEINALTNKPTILSCKNGEIWDLETKNPSTGVIPFLDREG